jgi:putative transposase
VDEVQHKLNGRTYWLWPAADQDGTVRDILVQVRRRQAAARDVRRMLRRCGRAPRVIGTDTLACSPPAIRRVLPATEHRRHKRLDNRAEHSHRATRRRERALQRFTSPEQARHVLACFGAIRGRCCPRRHLLPAARYREVLATRFRTWHQDTGLAASA